MTGRDFLKYQLWSFDAHYPKDLSSLHSHKRATVGQHLSLLHSFQRRLLEEPDLQSLPLSTALLHHLNLMSFESFEKNQGWLPGTHFRYLCAMDGAFSNLGKYCVNSNSRICLSRWAEWANAKKSWDYLAKQFQPVHQTAATAEDIALAVSIAPDREIAMFLALLWLMAARKGDVASLTSTGVTIDRSTNRLQCFIHEGKGVRARQGKYHVISHVPDQWLEELAAFLEQARRENRKYLFRSSLKKSSEAIRALRAANPSLNLQSCRRGAAQALAKDPDVSEETMMKITGHKNPNTLRRYLDWDRINAKAHQQAQTAARNNLMPRVAALPPPAAQPAPAPQL